MSVSGPDGGGVDGPPAPQEPVIGEPPPEGIFVSASKGTAGADGTSLRPVPTIAEAIPLAVAKQMPVNVCAETYNEALKLSDGVTMFGYYDCSDLNDWKRVESRAKIVSPTSPAVRAENLVAPIRFAGFDVEAPDAAPAPAGSPASSSYGMIVKASKNLELSNVSIRAGKGQDGIDGVEPAVGNTATPVAAGPGKAQSTGNFEACGAPPLIPCTSLVGGASGGTNACAVGAPGGPGGRGGDGAKYRDGQLLAPNAEYRGRELTATPTTAQGGPAAGIGSNGAAGPSGTDGRNGVWSFTVEGFVPAGGTAGVLGQPGQGGGGGGGRSTWQSTFCVPRPPPQVGETCTPPTEKYVYGGTGGGGGAGGCAGVPGTAGTGGGASIGLFIVESTITVLSSRIESGKGGRAGKGTLGTDGTAGQAGGAAVATSGGAGGRGGDGGHAGLSGHGAPGPSIALVFQGTGPTRNDVTLVAGQGGDGAPALTVDTQTLPAVTGEAKQEHSF